MKGSIRKILALGVVISLFICGMPMNHVKAVDQGNQYVVISNESVDSNTAENTGTLSLDMVSNNAVKNLGLEAYKVDVNRPYNGEDSKIQLKMNNIMQYAEGDSKSFWVYDFRYNSESQISADLMYSGTKANVWVNNNQISASDAIAIGQEFDKNIYGKITEGFGMPSDVDNDGKVNILCYDIQDGFSGFGAYIGGYFYAGDLYNSQYSNNMEVFYIDTYPAMGMGIGKEVSSCFGTLAHEFQHMINYNENVFIEKNLNMDTWLNEGLSEAATQVYTGKVSQERIDYYNASSQIAQGASLLRWTSSLENYSLSYLFLQYLKQQAGIGDSIFKEIIQSPYNDYRAVEQVIKKYIDPNLTFGKFMTDFRAAMVLKAPMGLYGFKGDSSFDSINTPIYYGTGTSLYGGGAVVKTVSFGTRFSEPSDKGTSVKCLVLTPNIYDLNGDGVVNTIDLALIAKSYNTKMGNSLYKANFDFNKDNIIDIFDLVKMSRAMQSS